MKNEDIQTHKMQGFTLTLERDGESIYADIEKGDFCSSLCFANDQGVIENGDWTETLRVPDKVLEFFTDKECEFFAADKD